MAALQTAPFKTFPVALSTSFHAVPVRFSGIKQIGSPGTRPPPPTQADVGEITSGIGVGVGVGVAVMVGIGVIDGVGVEVGPIVGRGIIPRLSPTVSPWAR